MNSNKKSTDLVFYGVYYSWILLLLYNYFIRIPIMDMIPPCRAGIFRIGLLFFNFVISLTFLIIQIVTNIKQKSKFYYRIELIIIPFIITLAIALFYR